MAGKKRTRNGQVKPIAEAYDPESATGDVSMTDVTPPCAQPQSLSTTSTEDPTKSSNSMPPLRRPDAHAKKSQSATKPPQKEPQKPNPTRTSKARHGHREKYQKLPKLPPNASISRRPLLHPAIPNPFSAASSPKIMYIKASTPYVPALKRIRHLLEEITKREKQSLAARMKMKRKDGNLRAADVERSIAEDKARSGGVSSTKEGEKEKVYLKATGRAIPRALELGVAFQAEAECVVRVEMGSVKAIDDIEMRETEGDAGDMDEGGEVPETRIRSVSSMTVSIGFK
ncbi:Rpp20 subunit of nuclear RNase MRP and P-domain-containing protein [Paraphoma chrysanthemicola]|uniref:Rpp20 subunit of nuclear RNase MRP and P-domain-containing protein n=1 Tax=Paraphoma chrysanthemicola TaxID=798071 RepID=A0A8K0VUJ9_9PLEO|nr:Rpp20 subunit of nuclear RNase MRP and P-domain-containing protein [Paraphoma chrysanthemicola]